MHDRYKKKTCFMVTIVLVIFCFAVHPCVALAKGQTGSLTVYYRLDDGKTVNYIDGAEFSLYHVEDQDSYYGMSSDEIMMLADELSGKIRGAGISGVTDEKGIVVFPDVETGIYLVKQTGRSEGSKAFETAKPFLVSVPSGDGYDVVCYPKTVKIKTVTPKTGDGMNIESGIITLLTGCGILAGVLISFKTKGGNERC